MWTLRRRIWASTQSRWPIQMEFHPVTLSMRKVRDEGVNISFIYYKVEVWCIWYLFFFTELKKMLDLSYNIKHPSELPVDCLWMFLIAISWESRLPKNDFFFFFYQLFHWRRSWTMRFWRRVMCVSGSRLWSCPPLSTTGSLSMIKPSRALRYGLTFPCFKITHHSLLFLLLSHLKPLMKVYSKWFYCVFRVVKSAMMFPLESFRWLLSTSPKPVKALTPFRSMTARPKAKALWFLWEMVRA